MVHSTSVVMEPLRHIRHSEVHLGEQLVDWVELERRSDVFAIITEEASNLSKFNLVIWDNMVELERDELLQGTWLNCVCSIRRLFGFRIKHNEKSIAER